MRLKILKKWWLLEFIKGFKLKGECDAPTTKGKKIKIRESLKGEIRLDTIIHEQLHAADWTKDEEWVNDTATDIARNLWRLGYRNINEKSVP
jgi:hypothetical protein